MNKLVFALLSLVVVSSGAYERPEEFVGGYRTTANCDLFSDAERVYVYYEKTAPRMLDISAFGDDASGISILLGSGERQAPGTRVDVHGEVIQKWNSEWSDDGQTLTVYSSTSRPSMNYYREMVNTVTIKDDLNVVITRVRNYQDKAKTKTQSCELFPTLTSNQKEAGCESIYASIGADISSVKTCLNKGSFRVTENSEGQLTVEYEAKGIKKGATITCELLYDKPVGDFAPTVEFCE